MKQNIKMQNKLVSIEEIQKISQKLKKEGKKIGLCTGSFDLIHPGHITHLESAKRMCDVLVVSIALDSYSKNKNVNSGRPVFSQHIRAFTVSKLKPEDFVTFDDGTLHILEFLKPDVYIKGLDYADETVPGIIKAREIVTSYGGKSCYTLTEKFSTTSMIKYIKEEIKI
jgi:rfaE bifunctional protein nucleotidyltransferase chain/domain